MKYYYVDFYKNENLSPDERNAMRRNQSGVWLSTGYCTEASSPQQAIAKAKREVNVPLGVNQGFKLRARRA